MLIYFNMKKITKKKDFILVLTTEPFPKGGAPANRILSYSKGLKEQGKNIIVYCLRPADRSNSKYNNIPEGEYEGIKYKYIHGTTQWPRSRSQKLKTILNKYPKLYHQIISDTKSKNIESILISTDDCLLNIELFFLAKRIRSKVFLVVDEYPRYIRLNKQPHKTIGKLTNLFRYRLNDGMILITDNLITYYKKLASKHTKFYKLPMSVEIQRFANVTPHINDEFQYIVYCGLEPEIDGLDLLLEAFLNIHQDLATVKLLIVGDNPNGLFLQYRKFVKDNNLQDKVLFTGSVSRSEIPGYLHSASLLALTRVNTITAHGGFPTKLGEYLATRKPVLVTNTGEIKSYLTNNQSAFIIEPNDVKAIEDKIKYIVNNYHTAIKVGKEGYKVAMNCFDYKTQAIGLINFIEEKY